MDKAMNFDEGASPAQEPVVRCWRNLRYAEAPVGALRFRPPRICGLDEQDLQLALRPQPPIVAPQRPSRLERVTGSMRGVQSEDCLRLTVWARGDAAASGAEPRPVLVWLHGGAWLSGGGGVDWYDGGCWARESGVVVVGVNYRLGALGWLAGDDARHSNLGLQDIAAALRWIAAHIARFGGNAQRITLMGQSAGGENIAALLQATGELPFQRVIVQSAPLGEPVRGWDEAQAIRAQVWRNWAVRNWDEARALPVEQILAGQMTPALAELAAENSHLGLVYRVIADGLHVPQIEQAQLVAQAAGRLPSMVGATHTEMAAFPGRSLDEPDLELGREVFNAPAHQWQRLAHSQGQRSWRYDFTAAPSAAFQACHCVDLPFSFGSFDAFAAAPMLAGSDINSLQALGRRWREALQSFVRDGQPGWVEGADRAQVL